MAFQQYDGPLMGMSVLEFRYTKQFFQKDCFFCDLLWSLWVFSAVFLRCRTQIPLPAKVILQTAFG